MLLARVLNSEMEIFLSIVVSLIGVIVWFSKRTLDNIETSATDHKNNFLIFKETSSTALTTLNTKTQEIKENLTGMSTVIDRLKTEMQQVHIQNAKLDPKEVKENFGRVILLEEKSRVSETMHLRTAQEIAEIKARNKSRQ